MKEGGGGGERVGGNEPKAPILQVQFFARGSPPRCQAPAYNIITGTELCKEEGGGLVFLGRMLFSIFVIVRTLEYCTQGTGYIPVTLL